MGERHHQGDLDPGTPDELQTLTESRQQLGRVSRPEKLDGVWIEGHHRRSRAEVASSIGDVPQDLLMTEVDAVEVADAEDRAAWRLVGSEGIAQDPHGRLVTR
jgi:hypothetical protein